MAESWVQGVDLHSVMDIWPCMSRHTGRISPAGSAPGVSASMPLDLLWARDVLACSSAWAIICSALALLASLSACPQPHI